MLLDLLELSLRNRGSVSMKVMKVIKAFHKKIVISFYYTYNRIIANQRLL